ncbi:hypothetical protein COO60DRAFT_1698194 [Scenedesmus sp. NREL 46B-D3]|nr:hypothetical protein COO60DRAFT_1698194 [Scenedesmus sp. NREL 46B-D3]
MALHRLLMLQPTGSIRMNYTRFFMVVGLYLGFAARHAAGQGLVPSSDPRVGATNTLTQLQQQYKNSQAWKRAYKQKPRSACGRSGGASLCAAQETSATDAHAQLMLATSPQAYSSTSSSGPRLVSPAQDEAECQACTAFAVAAAAETAMAAALQVEVQHCSISVQALFFCAPNEPTRSCEAGWSLREALQQLQQRGQNLPTASCLPYNPDYLGELSADVLCRGRCNNPSTHAGRGKFSSQQITSMWKAQRHIRQYGSVVSRFDVYSDSFFADRRNAQAVYRPSASAYFQYHHAITLVGYNNERQYWLAKNSYGSSWADFGLFKIAYGVSAVMATDKGEAYGVVWTPSSGHVLQLPVTPGPRPACYWYKARPGDYLSRVAWLAGIPLDRFMLDNTDRVKDLDTPVQGVQLLLCNPQQGTFRVPGSNPTATSGLGSKPTSDDAQLEALLRVKAAVDSTGVMRDWARAKGANGGYCKWKGVACTEGTTSVWPINIWVYGNESDIQGLKGTLPPAATFAGLGGLTEVIIGCQPGITGTLPVDWSRMAQLQRIILANNSLTGSIPLSWSGLSKLKILTLWGNKLSGRIPNSLGALASLEVVGLYRNTLSGTIPDLSRLTKLKELYLQQNKLSGRIPDSLGALNSLEIVALDDNDSAAPSQTSAGC